MDNYKDDIERRTALLAGAVVETRLIKISERDEFVLQSGETSCIYYDMRAILSYPMVAEQLISLWKDKIKGDYDFICGVATGGIGPAAILANQLGLPFLYVRNKSKEYGLSNCIEGHVPENEDKDEDGDETGDRKKNRVLLIDDVITTGGSLSKATQHLADIGLQVEGIAVILDRTSTHSDTFNNIPLYSALKSSDFSRYI